jgi:hypothetical protein
MTIIYSKLVSAMMNTEMPLIADIDQAIIGTPAISMNQVVL